MRELKELAENRTAPVVCYDGETAEIILLRLQLVATGVELMVGKVGAWIRVFRPKKNALRQQGDCLLVQIVYAPALSDKNSPDKTYRTCSAFSLLQSAYGRFHRHKPNRRIDQPQRAADNPLWS
jgi:hypothetical protein